MSLEQKLDLQNTFKVTIDVLEFFHVLIPEGVGLSQNQTFRRIAFFGVFYLLMMISETINMMLALGDLEKMTEACFLFFTHSVQAIKFYVFFKRQRDIRNVLSSLGQTLFQPISGEQYDILRTSVIAANVIAVTFLSLGCITCCLWSIFPFVEKTNEIRLPLSAWYPFATDSWPVFELVYVYQIMYLTLNAVCNISMDAFMAQTLLVASAQLSTLNVNLKQVQFHQSDDIFRANQNLFRAVEHHKNILKYTKEISSIFGVCILGQFLVSVSIICITLFQLSLVSLLSIKFVSLGLYQICMLIEIFLPCYYGNEIIYKSMELTGSAFSCEWTAAPVECRRNLLYFMTRTQFELRMYAGRFFILSLETFVKIVKSSWSYFAVLHHVQTVKE